jgi:hypothetical protein
MNVNDDLFGNINLAEEGEIEVEEVSSDTQGSGEASEGKEGTKGTTKDDTKKDEKDKTAKPEIVSDLNTELIDVQDIPVEKEGKEEKDQTSSSDDKKDKSGNSSSSPIKPFADLSKMFYEEGVLTQYDETEFEKIVEDEGGDPVKAMAELVKRTVGDVHQEWVESYPEPIQDILKSYHANLPLEKIFDLKRNQIQLEGITEDKLKDEKAVDLRKQIITEHYKATTKFSDERIRKEVDNKVNLGEDTDLAIEDWKELKDIKKTEEQQIKDETVKQKVLLKQQQQERINMVKKSIYDTKEIIPSIPLTKKEQDDLVKSMTSFVYTDSDGRGMTDVDYMFAEYPLEMRKALHYYVQKGLFKIDPKTKVWNPDFSKVTNSLKTKIVQDNKSASASARPFKAGSPAIDEGEETRVDFGKSIDNWMKQRSGT